MGVGPWWPGTGQALEGANGTRLFARRGDDATGLPGLLPTCWKGDKMRTIILLLVLSVLATGYSVASKATDTVNSIKTNQSMQYVLINR